MAQGKRHSAEEVVNLLRHIEVGVANGTTTVQACKEVSITEQAYYRRRKEYGWLQGGQGEAAEGAGAGEREAEAAGGEPEPGQPCAEGLRIRKLLSPERRREAVTYAVDRHGMTDQRVCHLAKQPRGTQHYRPTLRADEDQLTQTIITPAGQSGRYGYRRIKALLVRALSMPVRSAQKGQER